MPLSEYRHRPWMLRQLQAETNLATIKSVVDVGAGFGAYREFLLPFTPEARWTAIEVWQPYVERFLFQYRYHETICADVREVDPLPLADIYILGDVIEHMSLTDAYDVWEKVLASCWRAVVSLPIVHYPQGEAEGNPFETHVATWTEEMVYQQLGGIIAGTNNGQTGCYIARGARELS